eukprot:scpid103929/ scgid5314/ 
MVEQCVWSNEEPRCEQPQCRQQMHTVNSGAAECEEQPGDQVACEEPTKLSMDVTPELEDLPKSQVHLVPMLSVKPSTGFMHLARIRSHCVPQLVERFDCIW